MYPKFDELNTTTTHSSSIRILLADADVAKAEQVTSFVGQNLQASIRVCKNYHDLVPMLQADLPELLLLGILDRFNSLDTCHECHQIWTQLPIVLLSRQNSIDNYFQNFRRLALTKGATAVVTHDLRQLDELIRSVAAQQKNSIALMMELPPSEIIANVAAQDLLAAINEINEIGSKYFGPLAQGHYWRKSHDRLVTEFPSLQNWSADHFGSISCDDSIRQSQSTIEDIRDLRRWVGAYINECERIIIDFGEILQNSQLSRSTLELLLEFVISG
jgi:CheY-like chemotaxis protein